MTGLRCEKCGKMADHLNNGLCDKCYISANEGPCGCFQKLERFK